MTQISMPEEESTELVRQPCWMVLYSKEGEKYWLGDPTPDFPLGLMLTLRDAHCFPSRDAVESGNLLQKMAIYSQLKPDSCQIFRFDGVHLDPVP